MDWSRLGWGTCWERVLALRFIDTNVSYIHVYQYINIPLKLIQ